MKRRDFLKLIGVATVAPSVLAGKEPKQLTVEAVREVANWMDKNSYNGDMIGIATEDIPKGGWVRVWVGGESPISFENLKLTVDNP